MKTKNDSFFNSISGLNKLNYAIGFILEHLFGNTFLNSIISSKRNSIQQKILKDIPQAESKPFMQIDEFNELDEATFRNEYVNKGKPVLIRGGAKHWEAYRVWGFDFFKDNYGSHPVYLTNHQDLGDGNDQEPETSSLREIIEGLKQESKKYARFNPLLDVYPKLLESLDRAWLNKIMGKGFKNHHVLFVGNKGTKTNIHNAGNENIFVQLRGEKRWLLWDQRATFIFNPEVNRAPAKACALNPNSPDLDEYPAYMSMPEYDLILREGDILYIPSYLWHYVENNTPTIGIGIRWISPLNSMRNSPLLSILELFNTSPSIFKTLNWKSGFDFNKIILSNLKKKV